jgi:hypothetical protein
MKTVPCIGALRLYEQNIPAEYHAEVYLLLARDEAA